MHYCNVCNYFATSKSNLNNHNNTLSHLSKYKYKNEKQINTYFCKLCNKEFSYQSGLSRHLKKCNNDEKNNNLNDIHHLELELAKKDIELVKKDYELEIKQREIDRLTYENKLILKELENKNLQINNINNIINCNNAINNEYIKEEVKNDPKKPLKKRGRQKVVKDTNIQESDNINEKT